MERKERKKMKKFLDWLVGSLFVMFFLPWAVNAFVKGDASIGLLLLLLYVVNPVYSAILGWFSGKDIRKMWFLPIFSTLLFLSGGIRNPELWIFAGAYLALGVLVMLLSAFLRKRALQKK